MRLISYYPTWSIYGRNFHFKNVPFENLTDLTVAFALPRPDGSLNLDEIDNLNVEELRQQKSLRVGIAIGGWGTCAGFIEATSNENRRNRFIDSSVNMVKKYQLNYLEIDWEYPGDSIQTNNLKLLLEGLRERLPPSIELSICVPCFQSSFLTTELQRFADFIVLMGYDMSGPWSEKSGHHSALIPGIRDHVRYLNEIERVPMNKIVLGCPLYARTFSNCAGIDAKFSGPGLGSFGEEGSMDYKDVLKLCTEIKYDHEAVSHYANYRSDFLTFEGSDSLEMKCKWAREQGLGGLAFWQVSGDATGPDSLLTLAAKHLNK